MKYYVFFDSYGDVKAVSDEKDLTEKYQNDPALFFKATCEKLPDSDRQRSTGHVGILNFDRESEFRDYLVSLTDEVEGFFECKAGSRPYNF